MYKSIVFIWATVLLFSCSSEKNREVEIFNASCEPCSSFTVDGKSSFKEGVLYIENTIDTPGYAALNIEGDWDLSAYNQITLELVNTNKTENLSTVLTVDGGDPLPSGGSLVSTRSLFAGENVTWVVKVPPVLPYPELADDLIGMRGTPYTIHGVNSSLRSLKVRRLSVKLEKALAGISLGIRRITISKSDKEVLPAWTKLKKDELFPLVDRYGQFIHKEWPGKTRSDEDLITAWEKEEAELTKLTGSSDWCRFGGYKAGEQYTPTGAFYVKKINGKWWMIDPDGHLFWSHGLVRVGPSCAITSFGGRKYLFSDLPDPQSSYGEFYKTRDESLDPYFKARGMNETFDFSSANLKRKYGENWRTAFNDIVHRRLRSWGMNTISATSDKMIYLQNRTPYCDRLDPASPVIDGIPEGLARMRDPFHTDFVNKLKDLLLSRKDELNSPWCFGYWVDNKISWGNGTDLARWVLKSSDTQPSKVAFLSLLQKKYNKIDNLNTAWGTTYKQWEQLLMNRSDAPAGAEADLKDFTAVLIGKYFSEIQSTLKEVAPGKLYLGCKFNSINPDVLAVAAKYADVLSFDLFVDSLSGFRLPSGIDKPVFFGEFHFGATDRGLFNPGLNEKKDQEQRGAAYYTYVSSALKNPLIIGTSWHQYSDQSTVGRFDGENFQDGMTDVCDHVYPETVEKVREVGYRMYQLRLE